MLRNKLVILVGLGLAAAMAAQQPPQPQVKVNMLNVCSPSAEEQQEIAAALTHIPRQPSFTRDFEIDRGRSILDQAPDFLKAGPEAKMSSDSGTADWVRVRREFPGEAFLATVQYSFSRDPQSMVETLVFRVRDPKDLLQIAIEDSAAAVTTAASMLATDTPASRIKLERFGKSSIVLARCPGSEDHPAPDQTAYEPLFQSASAIAARYRTLLGTRRMVPEELARVAAAETAKPKGSAKPAVKKAASQGHSH